MVMQYIVPIGTSNFRKLVTTIHGDKKSLFVDKTMFIQEILNDGTEVILITRPRRFGKTLNMSTLQHFLSEKVDGLPTKDLFSNLLIAKDPTAMEYQGKYPVIFISFKDAKGSSYKEIEAAIRAQICSLYNEFYYLLDSDKLKPYQKKVFQQILEQTSNASSLKNSVKDLSNYIYVDSGVKPYVLIDEYDTPIQSGYLNNCYEEVVGLIRSMLCTALKDNSSIEKGVLTGITRIAKESIFSELNNLRVSSLAEQTYAEHFGFTEAEVDDLFNKTELAVDKTQLKDWYNGYTCGKTTIYNPWSIMNCIADFGTHKAYWINTSSNDLAIDLVIKGGIKVHQQLEILLQDKTIIENLDENIVYDNIEKNRAAIWTLLVMAGYLKIVAIHNLGDELEYELSLPNKEVKYFYRHIIKVWLSGDGSSAGYNNFLKDLLAGDLQEFEQQLTNMIQATFSLRDVPSYEPERVYHAFMLGLLASLQTTHELISNRESGLGYYDVLIIPKDPSKNGVVLEFKAPKSLTADLAKEAAIALQQIKDKKYTMQLEQRGIKKIISIGIAFTKKNVSVCFEKNWEML